MAATTKTVALAQEAVTIHVKLASEPSPLPDGSEAWDIESKILEPGETVSLDELPPYLSSAVKSGAAPGLVAITKAQADKVSGFKAASLETIEAFGHSEEQESDPNFPAEEY